ncbi:MAG: DUF4920 domain-containing protein [Phycisphaerales bacterium]|nr:MAG: DUF4920 domain-containing protein [Phycisphaerales bacterium]
MRTKLTRRLAMVLLAGLSVIALAGCQCPYAKARDAGWSHYGGYPQPSGKVVALGAVKGDEKDIIVEGTAISMCIRSGGWVMLQDKRGDELFVACESQGFHLPTNAIGHRIVAHGNGKVHVIPEEQRRHMAEVSGASEEEIAEIVGPDFMVMLLADSVFIEGNDLVKALTAEEAAVACEGGEAEAAGEANDK